MMFHWYFLLLDGLVGNAQTGFDTFQNFVFGKLKIAFWKMSSRPALGLE